MSAALQSVKAICRAIYRVGDERVGQWSNPVSIVVGGDEKLQRQKIARNKL